MVCTPTETSLALAIAKWRQSDLGKSRSSAAAIYRISLFVKQRDIPTRIARGLYTKPHLQCDTWIRGSSKQAWERRVYVFWGRSVNSHERSGNVGRITPCSTSSHLCAASAMWTNDIFSVTQRSDLQPELISPAKKWRLTLCRCIDTIVCIF